MHWIIVIFYFKISLKSLTWLEELVYWNQGAKKSLVGDKWYNLIHCKIFLLFGTYLLQIRDHLYLEEQSHSSEQKRMRTEISDLTKKLHQKEITIATISQKATLLERQLKMELEIKRKLLRAQQVCKQTKKQLWSFCCLLSMMTYMIC